MTQPGRLALLFVHLGAACVHGDSKGEPSVDSAPDILDTGCAGEENTPNCEAWYLDQDGDGYGTSDTRCLCGPSEPYTAVQPGDCDDNTAARNPADRTCGLWGDVLLEEAFSTMEGGADLDAAGSAVTAVGDLNGDGRPDLSVAAEEEHTFAPFAGAVYLILGPLVGDRPLPTADGIVFGSTLDQGLGGTVSGVGDADGDGLDDLAMSTSPPDEGDTVAWLLLGPPDGEQPIEAAASTFATPGSHQIAVGSAGDQDGDGRGELLLSVFNATTSGGDLAGLVYIQAADAAGSANVASTAIAQIEGRDFGSGFGMRTDGRGDLDGDGVDDIIIGARDQSHWETSESQGQGAVFVFQGAAGGVIQAEDADAVRIGEGEGSTWLGQSVAIVGDVDGDGLDDLLSGAPEDAPDTCASNCGASYLHLGPLSGSAVASDANFRVYGEPWGGVGNEVTRVGDVDRDGHQDLLLTGGELVLLFYGPQAGTATPVDADARVGFERLGDEDIPSISGAMIAGPGDVSGDGAPDLLVGHSATAVGETTPGIAWVFSGMPAL